MATKKNSRVRKLASSAILAAAVAGLGASAAHAGLLVDVRLTDPAATNAGKNLEIAPSAAATFTANVWAVITGADADNSNENLNTLYGAVASTAGGSAVQTGAISFTINPAFTGMSYQTGATFTQLPDDGIADWANPAGATTSIRCSGKDPAAGITLANAASYGGTANAVPGGFEVLVGTISFDATAVADSGAADKLTQINWLRGTWTTSTYRWANFKNDGVVKNPWASGTGNALPSLYAVGDPITLTVKGIPQDDTSEMVLSVMPPTLRQVAGTNAFAPGVVMNTGTSSGTFTAGGTGVAVVPAGGTVAAGEPAQLEVRWSDNTTLGPRTGTVTITGSNPGDNPANNSQAITGAVVAQRTVAINQVDVAGLMEGAAIAGTLPSQGDHDHYLDVDVNGVIVNGAGNFSIPLGTVPAVLAPVVVQPKAVESIDPGGYAPVQVILINSSPLPPGIVPPPPGPGFGVVVAADVPSGGSLGGLGAGVQSGGDALGGYIDINAGTASGNTHVEASFRARTSEEASGRPLMIASDIVKLEGIAPGDVFVLSMSYSKAETDRWIRPGYERAGDLFGYDSGLLFLGYLDAQGNWVNAVDGNNPLAGPDAVPHYHGSWIQFLADHPGASDNLASFLGSWGVDTDGDVAWAIINHSSDFAVVPEPSSLLLFGGLAVGALAMRRRRHA